MCSCLGEEPGAVSRVAEFPHCPQLKDLTPSHTYLFFLSCSWNEGLYRPFYLRRP